MKTDALALQVDEFLLPNGLTVYLNEDNTKPEIFGIVVVKAGAKHDPEDATGIAHYQEHMLFKGNTEFGTVDWLKEKPHIENIHNLYDKLTQTVNETERINVQQQVNQASVVAAEYAIPNEFDNLLKQMGSSNINANTSMDRTIYYNSFPPNQIERWLEINSRRFINPVFRLFQSEMETVFEEKNSYDDQFFTFIIDTFQQHLFKNHPYGRQTVLGKTEHLKNPSLNKMMQFFNTYYVANNMALILVGDFRIDDVKPLIRKTFGRLTSRQIPEYPKYHQKCFQGREFIQGRWSPIKLGLIGFQSIPNGHPDEVSLEVLHGILTNSNQTGLFDKLSIDNKILAANTESLRYNDLGAEVVIFIPKMLKQRLSTAEKLIFKELNRLRTGNFPDWLLDAFKMQVYKSFKVSLEDIADKAFLIAEAFGENRQVTDYVDLPQKIKRITKEQLVEVAKRYFTDNYFVLHSKIGISKKEKLKKPDFKPVNMKQNIKSAFARELEKIKTGTLTGRFVDFQHDLKMDTINKGIDYYYTPNPLNDIYSTTIYYGIGNIRMPLLRFATELLNYAGIKGKDVSQLKEAFNQIGCSYDVYSTKGYMVIESNGVEENLEQAFSYIHQLITKPIVQQKKLNIIIDNIKAGRKIEISEPDHVAGALHNYMRYGKKSPEINRLPLEKIKKLNVDELIALLQKVLVYETEMHYVGQLESHKVKDNLKKYFIFSDKPKKSHSPEYLPLQKYTEDTIFLVHHKKAIQSKIFVYIHSEPFKIDMIPLTDVFNSYIGGGFSGVLLHEIRELRSLSYTVSGQLITPPQQLAPMYFGGYMATQVDKTIDALQTYIRIIRNMPRMDDKFPLIIKYLKQIALTSRPHFRDLSENVAFWREKGFKIDPAQFKYNSFSGVTPENIYNFYEEYIQNKPIAIGVVCNTNRLNVNHLKKFGKLVEMNSKQLITE